MHLQRAIYSLLPIYSAFLGSKAGGFSRWVTVGFHWAALPLGRRAGCPRPWPTAAGRPRPRPTGLSGHAPPFHQLISEFRLRQSAQANTQAAARVLLLISASRTHSLALAWHSTAPSRALNAFSSRPSLEISLVLSLPSCQPPGLGNPRIWQAPVSVVYDVN